MINGIVNLVWGNCNEEAEQSFKSLSTKTDETPQMECREGDDDWLIVDKELPVMEHPHKDEEDSQHIDESGPVIDEDAISDKGDQVDGADQVVDKGVEYLNFRREKWTPILDRTHNYMCKKYPRTDLEGNYIF